MRGCAACALDHDDPATPHVAACPWSEQACPVEGCRYRFTDDDGCGLARLIPVEEAMVLWDAGHPVERSCLAARRAEDGVDEFVAGDRAALSMTADTRPGDVIR